MAKWADYCIAAVRFNDRHTHIDRVKGWIDGDTSLGAAFEFTRQQVIEQIDNRRTFVTIFKNTDGNWNKGAEVFVITIGSTSFIKTKRDQTAKDNLDNLPEY